MKHIVVGVDGSDGAATALRWAVHEARVHRAELTAMYAWTLLDQPRAFRPDFDDAAAREGLRAWLASVPADVAVEPVVMCELASSALVDASADADLIVVGARGLGGFRELLLGSVSAVVAERSTCPVAVVRESAAHPSGSVVVGIDGSTSSRHALRWAAEEARARNVPIEVVHAWSGGGPSLLMTPAPLPMERELGIAAEHHLTETMSHVDLSGLVVRRHVVEDSAAGALVSMSATAALVVVGSRGRGAVTSILLGSTSRHLLHHAHCPVVIAR